ncbi:anthranilate synthase component I family protein, partial [Vibrio parahaemolyticus]|nr:anthranilate synthase component I family protein [Vibrio parahaemolyticus]
EDQALAKELIEDEKERAEHVMLVDLERNDLGRVSTYGSVKVNEFMAIEKYSHVMHIVSNVQGELRDDCDAVDVMRAVFPGGTITGAPKVRTMEIIEELEPTRRGLYTGSIGWFGFNQDMHFNIVIRTAYCTGGRAFMQSGAGIVIDSVPKHEYKESIKKAYAVKKALQLSKEETILS